MKERDEAQKAATESGDPDDKRLYKNLCNSVTKILKNDKKVWEEAKLKNTNNDPNAVWSTVKTWLKWGNKGPPSRLAVNGDIISKPVEVATAMNEFFVNKVKNLKESIPPSKDDPCKTLEEVMKTRDCTFTIKPVGPETVQEVVMSLKNSKSTGVDEIPTDIVKMILPHILPSLTHVINLSLSNSTFPKVWKHTKVTPLLKSGDSMERSNFRPISQQCILSKAAERIVFRQLNEYLNQYNLIHPNHHGGLSGHNTATALAQMYDQWVEEVEEGKIVGAMLVDSSAAFDMVEVPILLKKMKMFGLDERSLKWFKSYLTDRRQSVIIDGKMSSPLPLQYALPGGHPRASPLHAVHQRCP